MSALSDVSRLYYSELGLVPYGKALALQQELVRRRKNGELGDILLLPEHPPTITLGRHANPAHILAPRKELDARGIELWRVERGGEATYHGPGQLVGYLIFHLKEARLGVRRFVWTLEEALIRTLASQGLTAERQDGTAGLWVDGAKIAALGIRVEHGISYHGLALNIDPDLTPFQMIIPCGEAGARVSSLAQLLGYSPDPKAIRQRLAEELASFLGLSPFNVEAENIWKLFPDSQP